jgi:hypothetical protein
VIMWTFEAKTPLDQRRPTLIGSDISLGAETIGDICNAQVKKDFTRLPAPVAGRRSDITCDLCRLNSSSRAREDAAGLAIPDLGIYRQPTAESCDNT